MFYITFPLKEWIIFFCFIWDPMCDHVESNQCLWNTSETIAIVSSIVAADALGINRVTLLTNTRSHIQAFPINSLASKRCGYNLEFVIFKLISRIDVLSISCEIALWNTTRPHWRLLNIGSGNGLVPSGNKPLPEPMLTQSYVTIWHQQAAMNKGLDLNILHLYSTHHKVFLQLQSLFHQVCLKDIADVIVGMPIMLLLLATPGENVVDPSNAISEV